MGLLSGQATVKASASPPPLKGRVEPVVIEPHRMVEMLPSGDLSLETRIAVCEARLSGVDMLPRYPSFGDPRLADMLPSSPPTYPAPFGVTATTHSNMAILEQSRALSSLPRSGYQLLSPLLDGAPPPPAYLPAPSSAILPSALLYPHLYPNTTACTPITAPSISTSAQYRPNVLVQAEGRTFELLGSAPPPPPPPLATYPYPLSGMAETKRENKNKDALYDSRQGAPRDDDSPPDPNTVWRPY